MKTLYRLFKDKCPLPERTGVPSDTVVYISVDSSVRIELHVQETSSMGCAPHHRRGSQNEHVPYTRCRRGKSTTEYPSSGCAVNAGSLWFSF